MNKSRLNVLVTGCGGDIGQSIGKILKSNGLFHKVVGSDIHMDHAGKFIYDKVFQVPLCKSSNYFDKLEEIVNAEKIDLIIPVSEPELRHFCELGIKDELVSLPVVIPNHLALKVGFDKLATSEFLRENNFPYPQTYIIEQCAQPILPAVLKSRNGSGSKSLFVLEDENDFLFYKMKYPEFIIQELVGTSVEEYTCGLFRTGSGDTIRQIIFKRKLMGGFSGFGTVSDNDQIDELLQNMANALNLRGSINVQLRLTAKGPVVFEINPRFSSTVLFRHMLGFEDVIWSIQDRLSLPINHYNKKKFTNFYKGFAEYVD